MTNTKTPIAAQWVRLVREDGWPEGEATEYVAEENGVTAATVTLEVELHGHLYYPQDNYTAPSRTDYSF